MSLHENFRVLLNFIRKGLSFLILSFFLFSCRTCIPEWQTTTILSANPDYNSSRLFYPALNPFNGLEVEIIHTLSGMRMYLNALSLSFPMEEEHPELVTVNIELSENVSFSVLAERLGGGQRLLLSDEAAQKVVNTLLNGEPVFFSVGHYSTQVSPYHFHKEYQPFMKFD